MDQKIIVVGYPKSGTTWIVRLVAELIRCPVVGFWGSDKYEIAVEGLERDSSFECYKSHHQRHELGKDTLRDPSVHLIYVLRDPRDIAISGTHYWRKTLDDRGKLGELILKLPVAGRAYTALERWIRDPQPARIEKMTDALLIGSRAVHFWCRVSWLTHLTPYLESGALVVRYEDALASPVAESERILAYLGQTREAEFIESAVEQQSFSNRKSTFSRLRETDQAAFLRVGRAEQWRDELTSAQREAFSSTIGEDLQRLGYCP